MVWGVHLSGHRAYQSHSTVHNDRPPAGSSGPAVHHHPYPYDIVSPASLTPDIPDLDQSPSSCYRHESPHFSRPLSMSVFNDPAFSSDPRAHPHFPLTDALFCKELPSKSPVITATELSHTPPATPSDLSPHQEDPSFIWHSPESGDHSSSTTTSSTCVSSNSDTHTALPAFTSLTAPSTTPHSHSPAHPKTPRVSPNPPSQLPFPSSVSASPCHDQRSSPAMPPTSIPKHNTSAPEQCGKTIKPPTVQFQTATVHADGGNIPEGKHRMKNFMRRLTGFRALDRIDEIDEADPFGAGRHYVDPFEAIGSNLARLGPAHMYNDIDVLRGDLYSTSKRQDIPCPVRTRKSVRMPRVRANGPSENVVPGQIFRHSPTSGLPSPVIPPPNTVNKIFNHKPGSGQSRSRHSHSAPCRFINPSEGIPPSRTSPHTAASHSSPPSTRVHTVGDETPHMPHYPQAAYGLSADPLYQIQSAPDLPPDHNEQYPETPRGDVKQGTLPIVEPSAGQRSHLISDFSRHRSSRSLDSSHTHTTRTTHSTSHPQNSLQPPRNHHLPKRLVMPAPLQPQQQQPPLYPQAHSSYGHYAEYDTLSPPDCHIHDQPGMFNQGRKLLRKKMAVFPGNAPLPMHVPVANAIPPLTKYPFLNAENDKERARRRRLSKRKHDG